MTSDDQQFLDLLASIPSDVAHYGSRLADYIEKHTNSIASDIRDALDNATWIPESLRPPRLSGSHHFFAPTPPPPQGIVEKSMTWISRNRTAIAVVVAFSGTTLFLVHRRKRAHVRKRRAKKLANGAKKEIVVLACSTFHDPLTKSVAVDLERRGYIVYVTVSSTEEDSLIQQEAKPDLRPLWVDLTSTVPNPAIDVHPNFDPIKELINKSTRESSPSSGRGNNDSNATSMNMTLAGIIVFPGCSGYPDGPFTLLPPSDLVDTINTRLMAPVLTVQQFLPFLNSHSTNVRSPSSIVIAYPSITQSLTPPGQTPETLVTTALSSLAASLRREVKAANANITVTELKLGNFDLGSMSAKTMTRNAWAGHRGSNSSSPSPSSSTLTQKSTPTHWHSSQREAIQRSRFGQSPLSRGSSAREFHNAVFDALAPTPIFRPFNISRLEWQPRKKSEIVFVGSGARLYDIIGKMAPSGLVAWMMRSRSSFQTEFSGLGLMTQSQYIQRYNTGQDQHLTQREQQMQLQTTQPNLPNWGSGSESASLAAESGVWEKL